MIELSKLDWCKAFIWVVNMNIVDGFKNDVRESDYLICFGVGRRFKIFNDLFSMNQIIVDKVYCCVDNDSSKQGKTVELSNKILNIWSMECLISFMAQHTKKRFLFLVTIAKSQSFFDLFQSNEVLNNIKVYFFSDIYACVEEEAASQKVLPSNIKLAERELIPRKIHYCWFGHNPIPEECNKYVQSWKKYCPDYEIIQWNEDNYDVMKNKYMYEAYKQKKWAFVSDYARLDIVYQEGGVYLDTDVELLKPLDDFLYQKGFIGFETSRYVNTGLGFGAIAGLDIIRELRDEYEHYEFIDEKGNCDLTPCPHLQTNYLLTKGLELNGEFQKVSDLTIYPVKVLCGINPISFEKNITAYTVAIHHFKGSWLD